MALSRDEQIAEYGWTALSCDSLQWGGDKKNNRDPEPQLCSQKPLPNTPLIKAAMEYIKVELPEHTFNHSMRVFYYGQSPQSPSPSKELKKLMSEVQAWQ